MTAVTRWLLPSNTQIKSYAQYDIAGNVVITIDPEENATSIYYDDNFGVPDDDNVETNSPPEELGTLSCYAFPTSVTNAMGHVVYSQYDYYLGAVVDAKDANDVITSSFYDDPLDRPTQVILADNVSTVRRQKSFAYDDDPEDRIITVKGDLRLFDDNLLKSQMLYDGDGRRIKKATPAETLIFVYNINGQLVAEYTTSTPEQNGTSYLTSDNLGSPRVTTKSDGSVRARHDYLPFGEELYSSMGSRTTGQKYDDGASATDKTRQKFTQKERDIETGMDYFLARYYSSMQGRFTSYDPIFVTAKRLIDPQRLNLYAYARNNPLKFVDPHGTDVTVTAKNEEEARKRFATFQLGLKAEDRKHVQFFIGNGKNGYKKGQFYIKVDANHKSESGNFQAVQLAANDRSALGRISVVNRGDTITIRTTYYENRKAKLETQSFEFQGEFDGYTVFQFRGKHEEIFSAGRYTESFVRGDQDDVEVAATMHHELRAHMVLGDFGRTVPKARH